MNTPYREHHKTTRPKVWTAKSVLVCMTVIALLVVAIYYPQVTK